MARRKCIPAAELYAHARERATLWRVSRIRGSGKNAETVTELVEAASEKEALSKKRRATRARPVLPTRAWDELHAEFGPLCGRRRRR